MNVARNITLDAALDEARQAYTAAHPNSRATHLKAAGVMPGGNTRTVLFTDPFPVVFAGGQGARLTDIDGHEYVDFLGEYSAGLAGHSHPAIRKAIDAALDGGINMGGHNTYEPRFAELVTARFPSMQMVRFTNSGTEANLMAISTAVAKTGRRKVMVFKTGYHGAVFTFSPGRTINAPFDYVYGSYNDIDATMKELEANARDLACVILEPMLGGGGCIPAELPFLQALREATRQHGILLIFDEVMTSRLSPGGMQAKTGVIPDITSLGKYIGGGMSFGAFGASEEIMSLYDPRGADALPHAGTFNNNVLTMAAGIAALTEVYPPAEAERLNTSGEALRARLNAIAAKHDAALQFTGIGSMLSVHASRGTLRTPDDVARGNRKGTDLFFFDMVRAKIWIARRGFMALSVPLTEADHDTLVAATEEFVASRKHLLG